MKKATVDQLMGMNWHPEGMEAEDGYTITIPALDDFAVHGAGEKEAWGDYPDALRSHLQGYLNLKKVVPIPFRIDQVVGAEPNLTAEGPSQNVFGIDTRTGLRYETAGS